MCSKRRKNHGCGQKKPKSTSSAIFGVETAAKSCELNGVPTEFEQNRRTFCLNFIAEFLSPRLNFSPSTKKTTECSSELFFSINKFVFDFCFLCLFCYNAGQHAISRRKHTGFQHRVISSVGSVLVCLWCGRTDVRMYGRTVT